LNAGGPKSISYRAGSRALDNGEPMPKDQGTRSDDDGKGKNAPAEDHCQRLFKEAVLEALEDGMDCVRDRMVLDDLAGKMGLDDASRDRIIDEVQSEKARPGSTAKGKTEKKVAAKISATASKTSKERREAKGELDEAQEVIDELSCELEEALRKEQALKKRIAELEAKNLALLAQLGRAEIEPPPETASGDSLPPKDMRDAQGPAPVTDDFWGPHTGLKRPHERPTTAPITSQSSDKAPRPKTLPMPPKDDDPILMKSVECSVCGIKNTIESKLKGNVEFVCRGCSKRSFVDIGGG
jgi:hypothetical protein